MGVMSIPCCDVTTQIKKTGPVFVRAGWHHFVTMTKTGDITTWVPKTPLIIDTAGVTTDYWETNLDKRNYLKYRSSADWFKLDMTYDINTRGVCGSCRELSDGNSHDSTNLNLGEPNVSVFQNLQCCDNPRSGDPNCSASYYPASDQCHAKCSYTSRWDGEMFGASDKETPFPSGYMNLDGSTDGTGVSLSIRGSPDSARWVNWETPAEKAPATHPLATPDFGGLIAKDVECGAYHNIVRLSDDSIMAWGLNSMGQCNVPESLLPSWLRPAGVAAHPKKRKIFSLHCGFSTSAVMFNDGTVLCWGDPEVADEVNTWKFIKTSPIKRTASGEISCDGATSVGHPELLPDGNSNNPYDWVAEELYKDSKYNANTDWWGHWHNNKTPGFPHFDLGVVTDYVNPVNWKYVTDGTFEDGDQGGDQWSYRFATKAGGGESPCAVRGKNIKDYAVAMLRTGQIITTNKHNGSYAPKIRTDNGLSCRDCSTDLVLNQTDGAYQPTHATCAVADITIDGGDAGGLDCIDLALLYCNGKRCNNELECEAFKKLSFPEGVPCENGYLNTHPAEGVGCFSSSPLENGYNPNWAVYTDRFTSAGHARGQITEGANYPTWNTAQANYGWASLPSASMRMRGWNSLIPLACKDKVFLSNCLTIVGQNDPCNAECPSNPRGNIIGAPAGTAGSYRGNFGYFRYPEHLLGFGCVAGTNTTCWLGPAKMLNVNAVRLGLEKFDGPDFNGNSIPLTIVNTYSQIPLTTSRGGPCAECAFSGSSILHEFHLANISTGCRFHFNTDPDGDRNPLIDGGICTIPGPKKLYNESKMMPSKPWGPFQLSTNIGNLPHPPIMESLVVERGLGGTPYTVPFNGINGSIQPGGWDFRISPLTCLVRSKLSNSIQNQTNQSYSKYIEVPQEFKYFSGTVVNSGFTPIAAAYTAYTTCVCWPNQSGDSMLDGSECSGASIDGSSKPACGSGRLPFDCSLPGKRYNPTQSPASRLFGTGFTLEEYAMSKGILCSAISINETSFATAGIAVSGKCTINIWSTQKQNIPNKPLKTIEFGGQNISGIKYISNDELFIRFDENTNRSFGILNINTKILESIEIDLYNSSTTSPYNIGTDSPVVNNVISSNQTAVSLKQAGSNSFRFATVNSKCDKVLLFKYVDSSVGLTLEASFSATDIFSDLINTIPTNFSPIISGLEISKDGNKIAIGEGTDLFSTVVWGLATCAGTTCIRDHINGLTLGLSKNYYTELPSYEIIRNENDGSIERLNGPSQNVIRFNKSETSIGVYGNKFRYASGGAGTGKIWEATIWNLCYSSNTSPVCSTIISKNQIFSIDSNAIGGSFPSSIIVNFSNDLSHIAGAFRSGDIYASDSDYQNNISTIFYKNMLSNDSKIISNVYNEDVEYTRNITSINFIPNTNNMLVTFFRDQPFPGDNNKISEAIVVDYTTRNVGNSYPLWKRKLCGYRGGIKSNPPPTTWKGEYPLGCFTGWEKFVEDEQQNRFPNVSVGENICKCDESPGTDKYNRWMWNNPTLSYASGRTWAVHLRRSPWYRDRNNASVFKWKSGCEEFPEWGSDQIDTSGHIQKAYSHVINNYDDVKIWISGWMHDPCPPWPLDTWDSDLDIDIPLPPTEKESSYVVTANNNIDTRGFFIAENGITFSMTVKNSAKYPSWVPVPKASPTNERQGYSYKGRWIKNGTTSQWAQGLYGINPNVCGFTGSIDTIVSSFGISAAYQSFCTESETPWTEEKPNVDTYVTANYCYYGGIGCESPDP